MEHAGENADGFAVKFRGLGPGNVISGARAYDNGDDGFDFWQAEHGVTVTNSWSFHNGVASVFNNPAGFTGDGNGIKLGHDSGTHALQNMLVWGNPANGVDINGNAHALERDPPTIRHGVTIYNVTSAMNGKNFQFDENPTTAAPPTAHILRNNVSYSGSTTIVTGNTADHNTFAGPGGYACRPRRHGGRLSLNNRARDDVEQFSSGRHRRRPQRHDDARLRDRTCRRASTGRWQLASNRFPEACPGQPFDRCRCRCWPAVQRRGAGCRLVRKRNACTALPGDYNGDGGSTRPTTLVAHDTSTLRRRFQTMCRPACRRQRLHRLEVALRQLGLAADSNRLGRRARTTGGA